MPDDIPLTIECQYTCPQCGLTRVPVRVPARTDDSDVVTWVKATAELLGNDHYHRNPMCRFGKLDLWIPMDGVDRVGGPPVN